MAGTPIIVGEKTLSAIMEVAQALDVPPTAVIGHTLCAALCSVYGQLLSEENLKSMRGRASGLEGQYGNLASWKGWAPGAAVLTISDE